MRQKDIFIAPRRDNRFLPSRIAILGFLSNDTQAPQSQILEWVRKGTSGFALCCEMCDFTLVLSALCNRKQVPHRQVRHFLCAGGPPKTRFRVDPPRGRANLVPRSPPKESVSPKVQRLDLQYQQRLQTSPRVHRMYPQCQ